MGGDCEVSEFRLKVLKAAFTKAAEMPDTETREAHLRALDTENPQLAAEVRRLLIARTKANRFFEAPLEVRMKMLMTTLGTSSIAGENESQAFLRSAAPPQKSGELARIGDHFALYELVASGSNGFVFCGFDCHLGR